MNFLKQRDKQLHFAGGFIVAFFIALFAGWSWAFTASTAMGFIKEEWIDRPDPTRHVEMRDALATSFGGFLGAWAAEWLKLYFWS